ncbi:MAG: hypothetical protein HY231_23985 [Acidobacteria bacterium]|nr:hypothetical protein [Acidobacteriota bacterium]
MDQNTVNLLLQLIALASQLAPVIINQVEAIKSQEGKSAEEIFAEAGVVIDQNNAKAFAILAEIMPKPETGTTTAPLASVETS